MTVELHWLPAVVLALGGAWLGVPLSRLATSYPWTPTGRSPAVVRPAVVLSSAVLVGLVGLRVGWSPSLPAWAWFTAAGLLLAVIDLRVKLLPNKVLLPTAAGALLLLALAALLGGDWSALLRAVEAAAVSFAVALAMGLVSPSSLGMGDVKLAGLLGLLLGWLSWSAVLLGFFAGFLLQAVVSLALLVLRRAGRRTELPFGPALLLGTLAIGLLAGG